MRQSRKHVKNGRINHTIKRVYERYDMRIAKSDILNWKKQIIGGGLGYKRISNALSIQAISFRGTIVYVLYNKETKDIVTALTKEMADNEEGKIDYCGVF